ncbi:hypothetical protein MUK42_18237 [Musa troglodytarum]|uniref:Uncharacterized protein n=1 Tax=Musa troglodytarum TaxID=320322 RepID=A0A9E7HHW6_9LILI|nr:hypothetical protein MUK42_18237 [Musa troglodytarum]
MLMQQRSSVPLKQCMLISPVDFALYCLPKDGYSSSVQPRMVKASRFRLGNLQFFSTRSCVSCNGSKQDMIAACICRNATNGNKTKV